MKKKSKRFCVLILIPSSLLLAIRPSCAQQSPAEKEVRDVLKKFRQGVETGDRALGTTLLSKELLSFYNSLAEVYGPAKMVFPFEVGHLKILRDGRAKAEVYLNPAKDLFVFTLTNQDGAWKISHIEGIRFPLYSVPALPYTEVYSLPQEKRSWMMAEEGMAFKSRVYFELKKDRGEESAQKFFLTARVIKVSMDAWLPFIEGAAQFALYFAILETNYHGSPCTVTKASYTEAEIRFTPLTEFEVLKRAFFYPKFSLDEYTKLFTRVMKDRARSCGLMLDITFDGSNCVLRLTTSRL